MAWRRVSRGGDAVCILRGVLGWTARRGFNNAVRLFVCFIILITEVFFAFVILESSYCRVSPGACSDDVMP